MRRGRTTSRRCASGITASRGGAATNAFQASKREPARVPAVCACFLSRSSLIPRSPVWNSCHELLYAIMESITAPTCYSVCCNIVYTSCTRRCHVLIKHRILSPHFFGRAYLHGQGIFTQKSTQSYCICHGWSGIKNALSCTARYTDCSTCLPHVPYRRMVCFALSFFVCACACVCACVCVCVCVCVCAWVGGSLVKGLDRDAQTQEKHLDAALAMLQIPGDSGTVVDRKKCLRKAHQLGWREDAQEGFVRDKGSARAKSQASRRRIR
jgi:hypothetical protein